MGFHNQLTMDDPLTTHHSPWDLGISPWFYPSTWTASSLPCVAAWGDDPKTLKRTLRLLKHVTKPWFPTLVSIRIIAPELIPAMFLDSACGESKEAL
jgi:hypothetical protein